MSVTSSVLSADARGGFRLTVRVRLFALVALAMVGLVVMGVIGGYANSQLHARATELDQLGRANAALIDLDQRSSNVTVAMRGTLLATTSGEADIESKTLAEEIALAEADLDELNGLLADLALETQLGGLSKDYADYISAQQEQLKIAAGLTPGSAAAKKFLIDDDARAEEISSQVAKAREVIAARNVAAEAATEDASRTALLLTWLAAAVAGVLLAVASWLTVRAVVGPLEALRVRMSEIADGDGDLTARLDETGRDETGDVARATNRFIVRVQGLVSGMASAAEALAGSVGQLSTASAELADGAARTSSQAGDVSEAADQVSRSVATFAAGTEEMGASIKEIASNASDAARVAGEAVNAAQAANETISRLGTSSAEISNVVRLITQIAEQTNLLALNATIEAARAGDAGKGFAVVAGEVKDLAQATAKATQEISGRIEVIQNDTESTVTAINRIGEVIERVSGYSTTIAAAVEEQTATTGEISRNVSEAAEGSNEIASTIDGVAAAAAQTATSAEVTSAATKEITQVVNDLSTAVSSFRY